MTGTGPYDSRVWRIGEHYGIHIYAVDPDSPNQDVPIATAMTVAAAAQIVLEHNSQIAKKSSIVGNPEGGTLLQECDGAR